MQCSECGSENRKGVKFCEECGTPLDLHCPQCGNTVLPNKKFCGNCGHRLSFPSESPTAAVDYQQPRSYTPKFMAEKILTSRSSLEGERKLVTVFFSDVAGFTSLSEKLDPEEIHRIMDGCFKIMMDVIHRYEGTINQFTGDGVMALFGAPLAHEDHARRACFAALDIQKELKAYGEKIEAAYGLDFKMRIGLNSGPVVVGAIGDDLRMDYTAIGDTTNLAARMESMATPGKILLTRNTYRLVKDYFQIVFQGKLSVKGKKQSQEVYELLDHGTAESRLDASKARGLTSFVGRDAEMKILLHAYERTKEKSGQVIGIIGEAGVGKSRLILEIRKLVENDCIWLKGRCLQYENAAPYHPLLEILKSYFGIQKDQGDPLANEKINKICRSLDSEWQEALSVFYDLFSIPSVDKAWEKRDPKEKQLRTFETLKSLFFKLSQEKSLVLVLDDLHWVDRTTEAFLEYFMGSIGNSNILLLLISRPAYSPPWSNKPYYKRIGLEHLSTEKSIELIKTLLGEQAISKTLNKLILSRASGNPLFLEELTHTLIEEQILIHRDKGYVLNGPLAALEVPDSIQGIIAARIDRLEDSLKQILQMASVIGPHFAYRILEVISGLSTELKASLHDLQRLEFIMEKGMFPELEYLFTHTLTQEVAYNSLLKCRKQELHERIGRAIEDVHANHLENYYEILAYHYSKSKYGDKAFHYFILAGKKATKKNASWDALDFFKKGLAILMRQEQDRDSMRKHLDILHLMLSPIIVNGFPDAYISYIKDGVLLSKELGDTKSLVRFYSNLGLFYSTRGKYEKGASYSAKAYESSKKIGDLELMAQCAPDLAQVRFAQGSYKEVLELSTTMIQLIERSHRENENFGGPANVYAAFLGARGYARAVIGHFEKGFADCRVGIEHCKSIHDLATEGLSHCYYGLAQLQRGDGIRAKEAFLNAIKALEKASFVLPLAWSWTGLGFALTLLEEGEQGILNIEKGLKIHGDTGVKWQRSTHLFYLAASYFLTGDIQRAEKFFRETLDSSREYREIHMQGRANIWLGLLYTNNQNFQRAEERLTKGLDILHRIGARPDEALGCYFFSKYHKILGNREASTEKEQVALEMIRGMKLQTNWIRRIM